MEHHNRAGLEIAKFLEAHPKIEKVWYPGLKSHPDYRLRKNNCAGSAASSAFLVKGNDKATRRFIDSLELFLITPSLGGSESLVTQMSMMSFFDYPVAYRESIGMVMFIAGTNHRIALPASPPPFCLMVKAKSSPRTSAARRSRKQ